MSIPKFTVVPPIVQTPFARIGDWMQTYTGRAFWPLDPRVDEIDIYDIAHALSLQCRFAGHCRCFYSVAEHSVRVARVVEAHARASYNLALAALLHDAAEAYLVDLPRPVKRASEMGAAYSLIEDRLAHLIGVRFGVEQWMNDPQIKRADNILLATEIRDLMSKPSRPWAPMPDPLPFAIEPWPADRAESEMLTAFEAYR